MQDVSPTLTLSQKKEKSFIEVFSVSHKPYDEGANTGNFTKYDQSLIYRLVRTEEKNFLA